MKKNDYRAQLKALPTEQLEKQVNALLNQHLDANTHGIKERASTPIHTKYAYAKQLLEKRKMVDEKSVLVKGQLNKKLANKIFEDLNKKGAGLGSLSIILIESSIEKHFPNLEKAVNMHDELVDFVKEIRNQFTESNHSVTLAQYQKTGELLKQAEQK